MSESSSEIGPEQYGEVRRKLVALGYLDGPIERFVLRGAASSGSGVAGMSRASLRAAALGGLILGGLLASAAVWANRPIVGAGDGPVLWGYFSLVAAAALFLLDLSAAAVIAALARRRGPRSGDSVRASILVGVPTAAYLFWMWRRPPGGAVAWAEIVFLAASVAATLAVAWLAGLVSVAGVIGRTGQVPDRARRASWRVLAALAPLLALVLVFRAIGAASNGAAISPSPFEPVPNTRSVLFVGLDGFDVEFLDALAPGGSGEDLRRALSGAARFPLRRTSAAEPAEVWMTVATGVEPTEHGVRGAGVARVPGVATPLRRDAGPVPLRAALSFLLPSRVVPTTGETRAVRALWEIVSLREPVLAVGWWTSWPASEEEGQGRAWIVTERALPKLLAGGRGDRDTAPAALFDRIAAGFETDRAQFRSEFERRFAQVGDEEVRRFSWESFLIDASAWRSAALLLEARPSKAVFVYLPGFEILRFRLRGEGTAPPAARRMLDAARALERYADWLAGLAAEALAPKEGAWTILIGDGGRAAGLHESGFVVVAGDEVEPGCVGTAISLVDVAPLVLAGLGYPQSEEMLGRIPATCLGGLAAAGKIPTYGRRTTTIPGPPSASDEEMLERLRSLGYVR